LGKLLYASLSIDLDNKWSYLKTANNPEWQDWPSYFGKVVPRIVDVLDRHELQSTVFVVGRDLTDTDNVLQVEKLSLAGHEIENHSFEHEPWLHVFKEDRIRFEIIRTGELIEEHFGRIPRGFRGPGYSDSPIVHKVLAEQGYRYCASSFPSCIGPIARAFYLAKTGLRNDTEEHKHMFGNFRDVLQSNRAYKMKNTSSEMWMVPVTVQPITRIPFHFTYLFYLSQYSYGLARMYFRSCMMMCRAARVSPSLLLHPLDFLTAEEEPSLRFFPGMQLRSDQKLSQLHWFLKNFRKNFQVLSMGQHVRKLAGPDPVWSQNATVVPAAVQGEVQRENPQVLHL
jgi:peptidoglycan-N-acetylglucosamine deacetylase